MRVLASIMRPRIALAVAISAPLLAPVALAQVGGAPPPVASASAAPAATSAPAAAEAAPALPPPAPAPTPVAPPPAPPASTSAPAKAPPAAPPGPEKPAEHTFSPEATIGAAFRLGSPASGATVTERQGVAYRLGLFWGMSRSWAAGIQYDRAGAGADTIRYADTVTSDKTERGIHSVLAELRAYPLRWNDGRVYLGLLFGFSHEYASHSATYNANPIQPEFRTARCSGAGSSSLAIGAGLGGDYELGGGFAFTGRVSFLGHRLTDGAIESEGSPCLRGAGTTSVVAAQAGFRYAIDLDKANAKK